MKAIILCAGLGTRLRPLTKNTPKPMIRVAGKPVLEHLADHLNKYGVYDIIVNLHYLPEVIMKHFGERFIYSYEPTLLGEEGTLISLNKWIEKDYCVVMNGDTLTNLNVNEMFKMSQGGNIKWMDGNTYAGTRIITPFYNLGKKSSAEYHNKDYWWIDIGTKSGLAKARKFYETASNLRELREQGN